MLLSLLLLAPAIQAGSIVPRQAAAPFDCGQVRVDSPNTTYSGFLAADLDTERRYVVTKTTTQKRLLTRFENNTLFTLVSPPPSHLTNLTSNLLESSSLPKPEQQWQKPHLWRNLRLLLGHPPRKAKFRGFGTELRLLQQRCRLQARRQARQDRGVHQRGRDQSLNGGEARSRERVGDILSECCEWRDHLAMGQY